MDNLLFEILSSKSRREVLRYLLSAGSDVTGRDLARHIGFSHQQAHNALSQLVDLGVVERRVFGPSHLFRLIATELTRKLKVLLEVQ